MYFISRAGIMAVFDPPDPSVPEFDLYVANVGK